MLAYQAGHGNCRRHRSRRHLRELSVPTVTQRLPSVMAVLFFRFRAVPPADSLVRPPSTVFRELFSGSLACPLQAALRAMVPLTVLPQRAPDRLRAWLHRNRGSFFTLYFGAGRTVQVLLHSISA